MKQLLWTLLIAALCRPGFCYASSPKTYEDALVVEMIMVSCGEPPHSSVVAGLLGGAHPPSGAFYQCPEYVLESRVVRYRIRPRKEVLLPVGDTVRFRTHKRDLMLLTEDTDKEIPCGVVEMRLLRRIDAAEEKPRPISGTPAVRKCLSASGDVIPCTQQ